MLFKNDNFAVLLVIMSRNDNISFKDGGSLLEMGMGF